MEKVVFYIQGGLGKVIMSTAVIRNLAASYDNLEIVTVSGYPEVFLHNPHVSRTLSFDTPYLWRDHIEGEHVVVIGHDPYFEQDWIQNVPKHLISIWTESLPIEVDNLYCYPELYFSSAEFEDLNRMIAVDKPLLIVQSTGGSDPGKSDWTRNPPKEEFDAYLGKYMDEYYIVHLALPNTPVLTNIHQRVEGLSRRQAMCLIYYAPKFVGIDSFGLHVRAAKGERTDTDIFLPIVDSVQRLSYSIVNNILPSQEVQDLISKDPLFHSTIFRNGIQALPESCPVPQGVRWFDL